MKSSAAPRAALGAFARFFHSEATGGVILLGCTLLALAWANSRWRGAYDLLLHTEIGVTWSAGSFSLPLHAWINDGLMVVFFFVVGLEIKREVMVGQLSTPRRAALPAAAALGGMLLPAAVYAAFNPGGPGARGWAIPMATDIAFALGILALLGSRVPLGLKVFLTALAIADDLGAVLVIAVFYSDTLRWKALALAGVFLAVFFLLLQAGVRRLPILFPPVVALWLAVLASGVHATVVGILAALMVPMRSAIEPRQFVEIARSRLPELERGDVTRRSMLLDERQLDTVIELHEAAGALRPPGLTLERAIHPVQAYGVLPLFAIFNAGVTVDGRALGALAEPIGTGVVLGLLIGKPLGVTVASWLAVRSGLAELPADFGWGPLFAVSWLAGIGFTMSLFVSDLAVGGGPALAQAKLGILVGSLAAGIVGSVLLRRTLPGPAPADSTSARSR